jgi:hypothetical protein
MEWEFQKEVDGGHTFDRLLLHLARVIAALITNYMSNSVAENICCFSLDLIAFLSTE